MSYGDLFEAKVHHNVEKQPTRSNDELLERGEAAPRRARAAAEALAARREGKALGGKLTGSAEHWCRPTNLKISAETDCLRDYSDEAAAKAVSEAATAGLRASWPVAKPPVV